MATKQAIPGVHISAFAVAPEELFIVGLDRGKADGADWLVDARSKAPLSEALVTNVMLYGVIEPVIVRKGADGRVEVIDGRQRVRAAREANKRLAAAGKETIRVPVVVKRGDPAHLFGMSVSANEQRIVESPVNRARKAARMLDMGKSDDEVAAAFGVTPTAVRGWLRLLDVDAALRDAVESGRVSASRALAVATKSVDVQRSVASGEKLVAVGRPAGRKSKSTIVARADAVAKSHPVVAAALLWTVGEVDEDEFKRRLGKWVS